MGAAQQREGDAQELLKLVRAVDLGGLVNVVANVEHARVVQQLL